MATSTSKRDIGHTDDVIAADESITFSSMHLKPELLRSFEDFGYYKPSPIQLQAIPRGKLGMDLIAQSKSGTGKTLTFATIIFERLHFSPKQDLTPRAMIVAPTREIAVQIRDFMRCIGKYFKWMSCDHFIGGVPLSLDKKKLSLGTQIIVGTPGRILQLIEIQSLLTFNLKVIAFDEADTLFAHKSFSLDIRSLLIEKSPKNKQILAFSASFIESKTVDEIAAFMRNPQILMISNDRPSLKGVDQFFYFVDGPSFDDGNRGEMDIRERAMSRMEFDHCVLSKKVDALLNVLASIPFNQCIVFINDKKRTKDICDTLKLRGFPSANIGGDQPQTQRLRAIEQLKEFKIRVLVTSDLTSRGIDCDRINLVINLDLPHDAETYLHRVGRTGRFGTFGLSITLILKGSKEADLLRNFVQTLKSQIAELPKDMKAIAKKKYLNYSLQLNEESEQKQKEIFERKRSDALTKNEENKLQKPSDIIKEVYVQKEQQNAAWKQAEIRKKEEKNEKDDECAQQYYHYWQYTPQQNHNDYNELLRQQALKAAKCFHALYG